MMLQTGRVYCKTDECRRWANLVNGICPSCVSNNGTDSESEVSLCKICSEQIDESEIANTIACDKCKNWFHSSCAGPQSLLKLLEVLSANCETPALNWYGYAKLTVKILQN